MMTKHDVLRLVVEKARAYGMNPFVMSGTALGIARCGDFLAHDRDIDLGLFRDQYPEEQRDVLMHALIDAGAVYKQGWVLGLGVGRQDTLEIDGISVDVHRIETDRTSRYHYAYVPSHPSDYDMVWTVAQYRFRKFSSKLSSIGGVPVFAPAPLEDYLIDHFGPDYMTPAAAWHWAYSAPNCMVLTNVYARRQTLPFPGGS